MSENQEMDDPPPSYDQLYPSTAGGYPQQEASASTQGVNNPNDQGNKPQPYSYPLTEVPPIVHATQQSIIITNQPNRATFEVNEPKPQGYLLTSIVACLCFCPSGMFAIAFALISRDLASKGKNERAIKFATYARNLIVVSLCFGSVWVTMLIVVVVVTIMF